MLIRAGVGATSIAGLRAAFRIADSFGLIPPDGRGPYSIGETMTYAAHRLLMWRQPLAREFARRDISKVFPVNGDPPESETYQRLLADQFAEWRLVVDGLVARPLSLSLAELTRLPSRTQITHQACEEGWSFIAEWTGVPLAEVLNLAGVLPPAKYVVFLPYDQSWDSLDMADAWHPQTLLAYAMNGRSLPPPHGAPIRLRVPRQLGYKSVKYLARITVAGSLEGFGEGLGSYSPEVGYSWYAGI
jgi:DMSO/TMAO reductase YedYZ molybdopterin-dependent catalytic subunit